MLNIRDLHHYILGIIR